VRFGLRAAIADRVAALTFPGSILARLFLAKTSVEGPGGGTEPVAVGKGTAAAFPALLEGLVGEPAAPAAIVHDERLPAGQGRHSGGHAGGKFTELERLIAQTGKVRPSEEGIQDADIIAVQTPNGNRAVPEAGQVAQAVTPPIAALPALVHAHIRPADGHGELPRTLEGPAAGLPHNVETSRVQVRGQAIAEVRPAAWVPGGAIPTAVDAKAGRSVVLPPQVPVAAGPGIAIPEKAAQQVTVPVLSAATSKLTTPGVPTAPRAVTNDTPPIGPSPAMEPTSGAVPPESALPEPNQVVPQPEPKTIRPVTALQVHAARPPVVTNREGHQQTSAAGGKFKPAPRVEPEVPESTGPAIVTEKPHAPESGGTAVVVPAAIPAVSELPEVAPAHPLTPNVSVPLRSPAREKEASPLPVSDQLPVAGGLDGRSTPPAPSGAGTASPPAEAVAGVSPRNGESVAPGSAKVRSVSIASPDRGEVAFAVELHPVEESPAPTERPMSQAVAAPVRTAAAEIVAVFERRLDDRTATVPQEDSTVAAEISARGGDTGRPATGERDRKQAAPERSPRPAPTIDLNSEAATAVPEVKVASHWAQSVAPRQEGLPEPAAAPDATPARPEEPVAARMDAKAEVQSSSAHEIKLEVSGGERRVEVRLSERGGEVRVAVRTPDSHLAGTLRESLPELTTRFAESGLRSEIWRPAGSPAGEPRHAAETTSGNLAQDAESQSRGNGGEPQGDAQQRQQRSFVEPKNDKEKGKDFAWLMSSLR